MLFVAAVCDPVDEAIGKVFPAIGLGVVPEARFLRLGKIQPFMLRREAQHTVQEMSELMDGKQLVLILQI